MASKVDVQGITLLIQSTSATQIHALFISYLLYNPSIPNLVAGTYKYEIYLPTNYLQFTPPIGISNNTLSFHGFNSFIIRNINI